MTATLRVDEEEAKGTAVWDAIVSDGPDIFFQGGPVNDMAGEAIEVVTPSGDSIFVLRRPASPPKNFVGIASHPYGAFIRNCVGPDPDDASFMKALADFEGRCETTATPALVRFVDPSNPTTLEVVEYGPDRFVDIVRIEVETTSAPVSNAITETLPWLRGMAEAANIRTGSLDSPMPSGGSVFVAGEFYAIDFKKGHDK